MSESRGPSSIRVGTSSEQGFAKFLLAQTVAIPDALVRFMAGPPMTERARFRHKAAEARIRVDFPQFHY